MFRKLKFIPLVAPFVTSGALAGSAGELEIRIDFGQGSTTVCEITDTPSFNLGDLPAAGVYNQDININITCEGEYSGFSFMFPQSENTDTYTLYSDEFLDIYGGFTSQVSQGGLVKHDKIPNPTRDGCWYNTLYMNTSFHQVGDQSVIPVGGRINTSPTAFNRNHNACSEMIEKSDTGQYPMTMRAIIVLKSIPNEGIDELPTRVALPLTLIVHQNEEES